MADRYGFETHNERAEKLNGRAYARHRCRSSPGPLVTSSVSSDDRSIIYRD